MTKRIPSGVEVRLASPAERDAIANLMQLYVHDFSELWAGTPRGELNDDGRFLDYPHLEAYWRDADRVPLLIRVDGFLAGFALLDALSHRGGPVDRNMAEFFIARKYRRSGVGTTAAQTIFSRYPGQWEAAVARRNTGALAFWRTAIAQHPQAADVEEFDVANAAWDGVILRFCVRGSAQTA